MAKEILIKNKDGSLGGIKPKGVFNKKSKTKTKARKVKQSALIKIPKKSLMKDPVIMSMFTDLNKEAVLNNPEVDASKFPGYDQANRIRGGLKGGGKVKLALKGGGRAYGKNS